MLRVWTSHGTYYLIDKKRSRARRIRGSGRNSMIVDNEWFFYEGLASIDEDGNSFPDIREGMCLLFISTDYHDFRITTPITKIEETPKDNND